MAKRLPQDPPQKQWIMITEEQIFDEYGNDMSDISICKLRHPKTEKAALYLISNGGQYISEITKYESSFGSWLIGESVQKDGDILMTTPVDPLFLALPYLINAGKSGKYMAIDQIIHDEEFPDVRHLLRCLELDSLDFVADMKGATDFTAYRYNCEKTLSWLRLKADNVLEALKSCGVDVNESGAQSAEFIRSKKFLEDSDAYLRYAYGLVSEYLPLELAGSLKDYLGIKEAVEDRSNQEPPSKKLKLTESQGTVSPTEDYSLLNGKDLKKQMSKAGAGRRTAAQKKLSQVDRSGMKSISSFFLPKS